MSVCVLDWGSISTITGAILASVVAWCISEKWNGQKSSEVISSECKNLWYELDKLSDIYEKLEYNSAYKSENHTIFFSDVLAWKDKNTSKINLIEALLKESGKNIQQVSSRLSKIKDALNLFDTHYMLRRFRNEQSTHDSVNQKAVLNLIDEVKKSLIPFIIYKKDSNLR
jgi:molybdopterin converting factor small subunit